MGGRPELEARRIPAISTLPAIRVTTRIATTACKIFNMPSGTFHQGFAERAHRQDLRHSFGISRGPQSLSQIPAGQTHRRRGGAIQFADGAQRTPRSSNFWHSIDRAAVLAVRERGQIVRCGRIDLKCTGMFLQLKLPSGRKLSLPAAANHRRQARQASRFVCRQCQREIC